jgi:hypothetical protein
MAAATAFFMRACASWLSALALVAAGANAQPSATLLAGDGTAFAQFTLTLSEEMTRALERGVDLSFELGVRDAEHTARHRATLGFRPLSRRYVVERGDSAQAFALRESALRALGRLEIHSSTLAVRVRVLRAELPPPLRLPAYLSRDWRLDSGWVALPRPAPE